MPGVFWTQRDEATIETKFDFAATLFERIYAYVFLCFLLMIVSESSASVDVGEQLKLQRAAFAELESKWSTAKSLLVEVNQLSSIDSYFGKLNLTCVRFCFGQTKQIIAHRPWQENGAIEKAL